MPRLTFDWRIDGRLAQAAALRAAGLTWRQVANELSALWGATITREMVKKALSGTVGGSTAMGKSAPPAPAEAAPPTAVPPPPPDDDVEVLELLEPLAEEPEILDSGNAKAPAERAEAAPGEGWRPQNSFAIMGGELERGATATTEVANDAAPAQPFWASENLHPAAPAVHTSRTRGESYLVISDLQIPFEHERALRFCMELAREYDVRPENVYNVGDEVDFHAFSRFPMDPEATLSPVAELAACRERLKAWYGYFPDMKLCLSNHGQRILKKAAGIQLPSQLLRTHAEILAAPPTWRWADHWLVKASKHHFQVLHGHEGGQSVTAQRQRSLLNGRSSVWGHLHASPGVHPAQTRGQTVWGCCSGSLIDRDSYAFHYNKGDSFRPWIGCAVIKDGGMTPILEPLQ